MWRLVVTVVLWNTITSQPIEKNTPENARQTRQLDFVHCCPCPSPDLEMTPLAPRNDYVDDCPCRLRNTDAQGSSSVFFPRAMRPPRPLDNPSDITREDQKPLLRPEVGLASSMLETLREVTDEEYQEAIARDAARNAARESELGDHKLESANKAITIVINPKEDDGDITPEASQTQESRCVHPLGTPHLGQVRESQKIFKLQHNLLHKNGFDMDSGASNVQEKVSSLNKGLEGLKLKTTSNLLSLFPVKKVNEDNIQSLLKFKNNPLPKDDGKKVDEITNNFRSRTPNLSLPSFLKNNNSDSPLKPLNLGTKQFKLPDLKINLSRKPKIEDKNNMDNGILPSNIQNLFSKPSNEEILSPSTNPKHFSLEKLLNLQNVELIPPKPNKPIITFPRLSLLPSLKINKPEKSFTKPQSKVGLKLGNGRERSDKFQTEILDTLPHASENHPVFSVSNNNIETTTTELPITQKVFVDTNAKTEILDVLPSASENNDIDVNTNSEIKSFTPLNEVFLNNDANSEHTSSEQTTGITHKLSEDNVENMNLDDYDDDIEITVNADENTDIDSIQIVEELEQPSEEMEPEGAEFDENGHQTNLDLIEEAFNVDFDDNGFAPIENENSNIEGIDLNPDQAEENESSGEFFRQNTLNLANTQIDIEAEMSNQRYEIEEMNSEENTAAKDGTLNDEKLRMQRGKSNNLYENNLLSSMKEKLPHSLRNVQTPQNHVADINHMNPEAEDKDSESTFHSQLNDNISNKNALIDPVEITTSNKVNIEDIQKMSNLLLDMEQRRTNNGLKLTKENITEKNNSEERVSISDMNTASTSLNENFNNAKEKANVAESVRNNNIWEAKRKTELDEAENQDNTCPSTLQTKDILRKQEGKTVLDSFHKNEMASEASESILNTARSPLLQQSILVQPTTLFDPSNLIPQVPSLVIPNLNLPNLEDIASGLSSLLGRGARANGNDEMSSSEFASAEDCSEIGQGMETGASTKNAKSTLPVLKPLEDISLNIFQMNPLSERMSSKMPSLNLNSFRTKLALPKSLELKPLTLESALGKKNGGLVGASLTFGSPSQKLRKEKHLGSIFKSSGSDILRNSLPSIRSLEDLRNTMRGNTQSLLKSPFAKPQDLLEKVSSAHEDMNDKLYAIHVDLQDRLSSIQDRIIDRPIVPQLKLPLLSGPKVEQKETGTWRIGNQKKKPSLGLPNSRKTVEIKKVTSKKPTARVNKLATKIKEQNKVRPLKISKAASSLNPKSVEVPKLITTSSKPPFSTPLQRNENLELRETRPLFANERPKLIQRKQYKPFGDFKVTIESSPRSTNLRTRPETRKPLSKTNQPTGLRDPFKKPKFSSDTRGFASEPKAVHVPAPALVESKSSEFNSNEFSSALNTKQVVDSSLQSKTPLKPLAAPAKLSPRTLPKVTESPLISQIRDSIRIKLSRPVYSPKLQHMDSLAKPLKKDDMSKSASENKEIVAVTEPMKENVSYKCKMVCVRD